MTSAEEVDCSLCRLQRTPKRHSSMLLAALSHITCIFLPRQDGVRIPPQRCHDCTMMCWGDKSERAVGDHCMYAVRWLGHAS